jgi:methyl-accepting chemotaxis protein
VKERNTVETIQIKSGLRLRVRVFIAAAAFCLLIIGVGGLALHGHSQFWEQAQATHAHALQAAGRGGTEQALASYQAEYAKLDGVYRDLRQLTVGAVLVAVLICMFIVWRIPALIGQQLRSLHAVIKRVSDGDLSVTMKIDKDAGQLNTMARDLNTMIERLSESLRRVAEAADNVHRGSQELSAASEQLSASAQTQASSLEETAASMEEMTSTVKQNADNAVQVDKLAGESAEAASESVTMASSLQRSMDLINTSSSKIADIIGVIDEIAFQTNLLALNAAVEAARAGEHGRGFAVVAAEVRSLAQRSAQAAKEIKDLITDSVDKVGDGSHLVGITGAKLEGIVTKVKSVAELVSEINASSQEQASGIEQVNRAVVHMDEVTQSTAAQAEELTGTSQSLASQAEHLRRLVSQFKFSGVLPGGRGGAKPVAGVPAQPSAAENNKAPVNEGDAKVQVLKPRRAVGANDDWTEF